MYRNIYLNVILTIIAILLLAVSIVFIWAVDELRFKAEKSNKRLARIEEKLDILVSGGLTFAGSNKETASGKVPEKMANSQYYNPKAPSGGRIISAIMTSTKNLNYLVNNESLAGSLWEYANDSLAEVDYNDITKFEPQLAESWKLSEDKMVYTIKLKKGVLWQDFTDPVTGKVWKNKEVTAADFKFYVDVIKNKDVNAAPLRVYFKDLEKVEIVSKYEFRVHWKRKYFKSLEITLGLNPLPRHLYHAYDGDFDGKKFNNDHERNRIIVGCGPYRFVKWAKGQRIIMQRWEKYYGARYGVMPPIKTKVFEVIPHPNTRLQALKGSTVDSISLTPEQWVNNTDTPDFTSDKGHLKKIKYLGRSYSYIGYNLKNPLFKDKKVRQALTHLVNRKRILNEVYHDLGRITTGPFFIESPYYDKSIKPYEFSVEKAKKLLKEAGWKDTDGDGIIDKNGKNFVFAVMSIANHPTLPKMLPIIKEDMAKAGIVMNINTIEWSVYVQRLETKSFEVCTLGWGLGLTPDPYQLWHSSQADKEHSSNHIGFKNKEADKLIEEIRVTFDLKKRIELCHKFHQLLHEEQPYTFLFARDSLMAINRRYQNVDVFKIGVPTKIMWVPKAEQKSVPGL